MQVAPLHTDLAAIIAPINLRIKTVAFYSRVINQLRLCALCKIQNKGKNSLQLWLSEEDNAVSFD